MATRRGVAFVAVGVALVAAGATFAFRLLGHECADLGAGGDFPPGTVSRVSCVPAFVVNVGGEIVVLLAESTHLPEEPIEWNVERRLFVSPFHGEAFSVAGEVVKGPARGPLIRCGFLIEDGVLRLLVDEGGEPRSACG